MFKATDSMLTVDGNGQLSHKLYMATGLPQSEGLAPKPAHFLKKPPPLEVIQRENRKAQKRYGKNCR